MCMCAHNNSASYVLHRVRALIMRSYSNAVFTLEHHASTVIQLPLTRCTAASANMIINWEHFSEFYFFNVAYCERYIVAVVPCDGASVVCLRAQ